MDWPAGLKARPLGAWTWPVTARRRVSPFTASLSSTAAALRVELRHLQARDTVLRLDVPESGIRLDGAPYARATPGIPAIVLQFDTPTGPLAFPCDRFTTWQDNLRAVTLSLEALRRVDRYGVTMHAEQYAGFRAIEAPRSAAAFGSSREAVDYLASAAGVSSLGLTVRELERRAMRATHPDTGGDPEQFARVRAALDYLTEHGTP